MHVGETLTDLQILACELHENAFGGHAPPGPAGRAIAHPRPIAVIRGGEEGEWVGREGKGNKGWKGESRVRGRDKGESGRWERVGLDLDICWGPSSSYYATAQAAGVGAWDGQPMRNCHDR